MITQPKGVTTICIKARYEYLRPFIERLPDIMDTQGTYIYGGRRNLIKCFTAPDGTLLNVKRYHTPRGLNKLIYSFALRKPKGLRAYTYPDILLPKGIATPEPVAYIEQRHRHLLGQSYFVSLQCPYQHRLYELGDAPAAVYEPMADALAHFAAHMHNQGVLHLDFSPGNVLWDKDAQGHYHFSIVDINRMRFGHVSARQGCKSFTRLWGPKQFIVLLTRTYASLRGFNADSCVAYTLRLRAKFWKHYQKKREMEFHLEL